MPTATKAAVPKPGAAAAAWYKGGGKELITTLTADINGVKTDDRAHDSSSMQTDCIQISADITPAQGNPPLPDAIAQRDWTAALASLHSGFWDCNGGYSDSKTSEIRKGATEIEAAGPYLAAVKQRIATITG